MANIKSFPNNQDEYVGAEYVMKWLHGRTSGVFAAENNASVNAVSGRMAVNVSDGYGWIANKDGDGVCWWIDVEKQTGSKLVLEIDMAESALSRIDRVVVTWQTTNYVALPTVSILKGKPSSAPIAPALSNTASQRQISLARIKIPAGATSISASMITDERMNPDVCGLVAEGIKFPTEVINAQFEELIKTLEAQIEQAASGTLLDDSVTTPKIKNEAVTTPKIANEAITRPKLAGDLLTAVENSEIEHQGTSGIWHYIKYKSGLAVCWGAGKAIPTLITTPWGSCYESDESAPSMAFPFEFKSVYVNFAELSNYGCNLLTVRIAEGYNPSKVIDRAPAMWGFRPTEYGSTVSMLPWYLVIGRWK